MCSLRKCSMRLNKSTVSIRINKKLHINMQIALFSVTSFSFPLHLRLCFYTDCSSSWPKCETMSLHQYQLNIFLHPVSVRLSLPPCWRQVGQLVQKLTIMWYCTLQSVQGKGNCFEGERTELRVSRLRCHISTVFSTSVLFLFIN